ncbi:MAG: hypothetical protein IJF33_04535 [Clostridia bacterium]|nr:hypothetical protein [Clostridia bacterium]
MSLKLQSTILAATGVKIPVEKDTDNVVSDTAKEIVLVTDQNNRASVCARKGDAKLGFHVFVEGERLVFEVGSKTGAFFAISAFSKDYFGFDLEAGEIATRAEGPVTLEVDCEYSLSRTLTSSEFPYLGFPLRDLKIAYDGESYLQRCLAADLRAEIEVMLGERLSLWNRSYGSETGQCYLSFLTDSEMEKGAWEVHFEESGIVIVANGYYGFEAAVSQFTKLKSAEGYFGQDPGERVGNHYLDSLGKAERYQSHKYAYDNTGEYRVMFYNVLFWDSNGKGNDYPAQERNRLQAEIIAEYKPDVLGCQEFNISKRSGEYALPKLLEELGYAETVDSIVDNASCRTYWLGDAVYDSNGALIGYRPGNGKPGGYRVDQSKYDFETTYYNHTPLYYNTATTACVASGYYWYENQWDLGELVTDSYGTYYASTHENGAGDCGSKSLTWGVFESLETGERYSVISTHMCTMSEHIRALQAQEVVALIEKISSEYDCPVFFGGDMNGDSRDSYYQLLVDEEIGYTSLQDDAVAELYTSRLNTQHGYPNHDGDVLTQGPAPSVDAWGSSIDKIFVPNLNGLSIKVFGVVADTCALRSSDHFPMFVDFSIE